MSKHVVTLGEVMMRLTTTNQTRFTQTQQYQVHYGGAEANVAISLRHLGLPAMHITRFPDHDLGKAANQYLQTHQVANPHITFGAGRLGLYFLENGAMQRSPKIVYDRFDSAFADIQPGTINWEEIMRNASWFHWTGITPAISQSAADVCLEALKAAKKYQVPVSGDINYRRNLWQYGKSALDVMPALFELSQYIVGGPEDFQNCLGIKGDSFEQSCEKVRAIYPHVKKVAFTYREVISANHNKLTGVVWDQATSTSPTFDMTHIVDRIGGGDAYMAGLIYGWLQVWSDQQVVDFAIAASVLKHAIEGDANLATVEEVQTLLKGENTGKLLR